MTGRAAQALSTREALVEEVRAWQAAGQRVVLGNGCFDLLHVGHLRYLEDAASRGDVLVIAINSDDSVKALHKGPGRPLVSQAYRAEVVAALACVDYVVVFDEPNPNSLIAALEPDVLVKGGDWPPETIIGRDIVEARGGMVRTIPLVPDLSTTSLVKKIQGLPSE